MTTKCVTAEMTGFEPANGLYSIAFLAGRCFKPDSATSPFHFALDLVHIPNCIYIGDTIIIEKLDTSREIHTYESDKLCMVPNSNYTAYRLVL